MRHIKASCSKIFQQNLIDALRFNSIHTPSERKARIALGGINTIKGSASYVFFGGDLQLIPIIKEDKSDSFIFRSPKRDRFNTDWF